MQVHFIKEEGNKLWFLDQEKLNLFNIDISTVPDKSVTNMDSVIDLCMYKI